jgi:hypothetical protein
LSSWVQGWAWRQGFALSAEAHRLLAYLADQADDHGVVGLSRSLSRAELAALFHKSLDSVDRWIGELACDKCDGDGVVVREALLEVERRHRPSRVGGVISIPNVYRLKSPPPPSVAQGRTSAALVDAAPVPVEDFAQGRTDAAPVKPQGRTSAATPDQGRKLEATPAAHLRPPQPQTCGHPSRTSAATVAAPVAAHTESLLPSSSSLLPVGDPSIPRHTLSKEADWIVHHANDPLLDPTKFAALVSGAFEVTKWVRAGADIEHVVLAVVMGELIKRRQQNKGPLTSWGILKNDVRAAAARFLTPLEDFAAQSVELGNGQQQGAGDTSAASGGRGVAGGYRQSGGSEPPSILGALKRRRGASG